MSMKKVIIGKENEVNSEMYCPACGVLIEYYDRAGVDFSYCPLCGENILVQFYHTRKDE